MQESVEITNHAYKRAKERLSWKKSTLNRMAPKAFEQGVTHNDAKGHLRKYLRKQYLSQKKANNIRIYGQNIYFFAGNCLMTIHRLPNNLIKYIPKLD